ncbi:hypothetical protein BD309DRAFT_944413 [Dichomitus squalens]|nr:hypothetical protein BD309DRAFT_944413 [Dichomitus squalens]
MRMSMEVGYWGGRRRQRREGSPIDTGLGSWRPYESASARPGEPHRAVSLCAASLPRGDAQPR